MKSHNSGITSVVTIASTATLIKGHDVEPRIDLAIINLSNQTVYYGYGPDVTTATGWPLYPEEKENESGYHGHIYGIVESGTAIVRVRYK